MSNFEWYGVNRKDGKKAWALEGASDGEVYGPHDAQTGIVQLGPSKFEWYVDFNGKMDFQVKGTTKTKEDAMKAAEKKLKSGPSADDMTAHAVSDSLKENTMFTCFTQLNEGTIIPRGYVKCKVKETYKGGPWTVTIQGEQGDIFLQKEFDMIAFAANAIIDGVTVPRDWESNWDWFDKVHPRDIIACSDEYIDLLQEETLNEGTGTIDWSHLLTMKEADKLVSLYEPILDAAQKKIRPEDPALTNPHETRAAFAQWVIKCRKAGLEMPSDEDFKKALNKMRPLADGMKAPWPHGTWKG